MPVVLASVFCLLLAACTVEQVGGSAYAIAKGACSSNPDKCTVHPDPQ